MTAVMQEVEGLDRGSAGDVLTATLTWCGREALLVVEGDVDAASVTTLQHAFDQALDGSARRMTLDLRGVTFMGTAGYEALVRAKERLAATGAPMHVVGASRTLRLVGERIGVRLGPPVR